MLGIEDWNVWLKGLIGAGISGATAGISTSLIAPETFNFGEGLKKLIAVVCASTIVSIGKYLTIKPLPEDTK